MLQNCTFHNREQIEQILVVTLASQNLASVEALRNDMRVRKCSQNVTIYELECWN